MRITVVQKLILGMLSLAVPGLADTFIAFGPETYIRDESAPVDVTRTFTVRNPNTTYTLHIDNGGANHQANKVSSAIITVNGVQIVGANDLNQNTLTVDKPVTLAASNSMEIQLRAQPLGTISLQIIGIDNDPPVITANASPAPNAAGWNNTNVTVTFACSDATSGVATCPAPVTVQTEGANQVVTGTAVDLAGNMASTSVTLKIDKTPPGVVPALTPAPNAAGWNNANVTVSFTCSDATSGIATCPAPVTVPTRGRQSGGYCHGRRSGRKHGPGLGDPHHRQDASERGSGAESAAKCERLE